MFIRNTVKTLSLAAAVTMLAGTGGAFAQEGGDGTLRAAQPLSERVAQAEQESVTFAEIFNAPASQQVAAVGASHAETVESRADSDVHPTRTQFDAEWRNLPQAR